MSDNFAPQAEPKSRWKLNSDFLAGLKTSADNNQPLMALRYVVQAFEHLMLDIKGIWEKLHELEQKVAAVEKTPTRKTATKAEEAQSTEE